MKVCFWQLGALLLVLLVSSVAQAQSFVSTQTAGKEHGELVAIPVAVAGQVSSSVRDLVSFRDPKWELLTIAQIGAATADAVTSLSNFQQCLACKETGISRWVVGEHPDVHKYVIAGVVEIAAGAVLGHYLRNRITSRKWYWRGVWVVPQSLSLYEHADAAVRNSNANVGCRTGTPACP